MTAGIDRLLQPLRNLHEEIARAVVSSCEAAAAEELGAVSRDAEGDTIYAVDRISEDLLIERLERELASLGGAVLVAEGLEGGQAVLPRGTAEARAAWRIIVDPIDGTRGLMYQKRSAWILTGVARNRGGATSLADIEFALQTEIPLVKQHLHDRFWSFRGRGVAAERIDRLTGEARPLRLEPSRARSIAHGFAMVARFFPGARDELAAIDEEIVQGALGPIRPGKAHCFEDQYISTGGQLYGLMAGADRFVADLRPLMERVLERRGSRLGICCHPYDLATELAARELGVIVTDPAGRPLAAPLSVDADVAWVGYANEHIRRQVEPLLKEALQRRGLMEGPAGGDAS